MSRKIKNLCLLLFVFIIFSDKVYAADYNISVTSNTVTVGNDISLRIDGSDSGLTGRFNISSSDDSVASISTSSVWIEKNALSVTIEAKKAGSAVISVTPTEGISDGEANEVTLNSKKITITVNDKQVPSGNNGGSSQRVKSANNYLTSITVDGLKLNEEFNKETLEYTIDVPADTEKIKINAQLADSNASIIGIGDVKVSTGVNNFELVVTAPNGSKRTYKLTATVLEDEPIKVIINKNEYTIIKKRKDLPKISEYNIEKDITIDNNIIEGYYNEKLKYNLVGLKDSDGKINYYIYYKGKYSKYDEYTIGGTTLQILDKKVEGYKKATFSYDSNKIVGYQEVKLDLIKNTYALDSDDVIGSQFYLFYAKNIETGKENLYQYDALEKTVQRYNFEVLDMYKKHIDKYYIYLLISLILLVILIMSISMLLISNNKKKKIINTRRKMISKMRIEESKTDL